VVTLICACQLVLIDKQALFASSIPRNEISSKAMNPLPQVIVVDGVASPDDVAAIRTAVQRGVSVVASCLGQDLQQLLANPELNPLLGGTQPAADATPQRCEAVKRCAAIGVCRRPYSVAWCWDAPRYSAITSVTWSPAFTLKSQLSCRVRPV